jgi:asperthecin polyketide synthase
METGEPFLAADARCLLEQICAEILTGTIYLDKLRSGILDSISKTGSSNYAKLECQLLLYGTSLISESFLSGIKAELPQVTVIRHDLIDWSTQDLEDISQRIPPSPKQSKLAVVGMSCRMPGGATDTELFWQLMIEGRDVHTHVPPDRFDLSSHYDLSGKTPNATETPFGNFIDKPGMFDAGFFNMSPREVSRDVATVLVCDKKSD